MKLRRTGWNVVEKLKSVGQQGKALVYIVMKFPGDTVPFLLLRLNQSTAHARQSFLPFFAIGDIDAGADVAGKRAVRGCHRNTDVEDPSVFPIVSAESVFHPEG